MRKALVAVVLIGIAVGACVRIPPARLLPQSITSIYIMMFENRSYEPGIEEKLTRLTQEEFLVDGRLDVTRRPRADAVLVGKLQKFDVRADRMGSDEFPLTSRIVAVADIALYDSSDRNKSKPLMTWEGIDVDYMFVSDARRVIEVVPDDAYEAAMRQLARQIVMAVMTRPPTRRSLMLATGPAPASTSPQRVLGREQLDTRFLDAVSSESLPSEGSGRTRR